MRDLEAPSIRNEAGAGIEVVVEEPSDLQPDTSNEEDKSEAPQPQSAEEQPPKEEKEAPAAADNV